MTFFSHQTRSGARPQTHFLVFLEHRKRVWWLQMSLSPAGFEGPLRGGERQGKGKEGREKERKERDGRKQPPPEINIWLRSWMWTWTERRGRRGATSRQLDNIHQGETQLFIARTVSFLLQRAAEHVPTSQTATRLRRLHYTAVSICRLLMPLIDTLCRHSIFFKYLIDACWFPFFSWILKWTKLATIRLSL